MHKPREYFQQIAQAFLNNDPADQMEQNSLMDLQQLNLQQT